jgi:hypothetical protein
MKSYFISKIWMNIDVSNFVVIFCVAILALAQMWKKKPWMVGEAVS